MEPQRFDTLVEALGSGTSRRHMLRRLLAGAVAGTALVSRTVAWGGSPREAAAIPDTCAVACAVYPGPQKAACKQACRKCRGDIDRVCPQFSNVGITGFVCCPEGSVCDFEGNCVEVTTCPSGEPADNCAAGIFTDCGSGDCGLVAAVGGEACHCVERFCAGGACASDEECDAGLVCVSAPGCCPDTTFCALPCGSVPASGRRAVSRRRRTAGGQWRRGRR